MDNQNRYFFLGALYATLLFFLIVLGALWVLTRSPSHDFFSMSDDTVMSVTLIDHATAQATKKTVTEPLTKTEPTESIEDLFESVETKDLTYSSNQKVQDDNPKIDENFLKKINKRTNIKAKNVALKQKKLDLDLKTPVLNQDQNSSKKEKLSGIKNAYYSKLYDLLYSGWQPYGYGEQLAIIIIEVHSNGVFTYHVKQWSASTMFNQTLQAYLESLRSKTFPLPESGKSIRVKVNFISKEKNE